MSPTLREYQAVVHLRGTQVPSESTIEFVIGIGSDVDPTTLFTVPVIEGQRVHPLEGRTDIRPFLVEGVDVDGTLTSAFTVSERWAAIKRLVQVRFRDVDAAGSPTNDWRYLGTGRITQFDALDGEGKFRLEVSDETSKIRTSAEVFARADTTQIWPAGTIAAWRGFEEGIKATVSLFENEASVFFVKLIGVGYDGQEGSTQNSGVRISERMARWIRDDLKPEEEWQQPDAALLTSGNFRHLRLRIDGHDYQILKFSGPPSGPILESIETPEQLSGSSPGSWATQIWCWCFRGSDDPEPPFSGEGYLYAPSAEPSVELPLHGGVADTGHWLGTAYGFIHFADFTRRILDLLGIVYDPDNLDLFEADKSFAAIAPRIVEHPEDPMVWLQDNIFAFQGVTHGRDAQGRFRLIDLRPKRTVEEGIPLLDASNARAHRWLLSGREQINSVNYLVMRLLRPRLVATPTEFGTPIHTRFGSVPRVVRMGSQSDGTDEDPTLDNFIVAESTTDPVDGDTLDDAGRILHTFDIRAAAYAGYNDVGTLGAALGKLAVQIQILASGAGALIENYMAFTTTATLATYQDGLRRGMIEVEGALSETMEEGDEFFLDHDSLKISTPGRLGAGLPPGVGPINPGSSPPVLDDPPTLDSPIVLSDLSIEIPIASIPTGLTARVEHAPFGDCVTAPSPGSNVYQTVDTRTTIGSVFTGPQVAGSCVWVIVSGEENGVRVTEYSTPIVVAIDSYPHFEAASLQLVFTGVYFITWRPSALTQGVLICGSVHAPGETSGTPTCYHADASDNSFIWPDAVPIGMQLSVTLTAYPGYSSGVVDGSPPGQVWPLSAIRSAVANHAVGDHTDSQFDDLADGDIQMWDETLGKWINVSLAGGSPHALGDHTDTSFSSIANGDYIVRRAGAWVNEAYEGTSFPGSPATGRRFYRTDIGLWFRYNGTRWLSEVQFALPLNVNLGAGITASTGFFVANPFWNSGLNIWGEWFVVASFNASSTSANYFTCQFEADDGTVSGVVVSTQNQTQNTWVGSRDAIDTEFDSSTVETFGVQATETGTSTSFLLFAMLFRVIAT